jgi:hypothetical protein
MPDPLHTIAEFIDKRINTKVLLECISPSLSMRLRLRLLTEQSKHGLKSVSSSVRQQAEVAHGVLIPVQDMLREDGNRLRRRAAGFQQGFRSGVFDLVDNFLFLTWRMRFWEMGSRRI